MADELKMSGDATSLVKALASAREAWAKLSKEEEKNLDILQRQLKVGKEQEDGTRDIAKQIRFAVNEYTDLVAVLQKTDKGYELVNGRLNENLKLKERLIAKEKEEARLQQQANARRDLASSIGRSFPLRNVPGANVNEQLAFRQQVESLRKIVASEDITKDQILRIRKELANGQVESYRGTAAKVQQQIQKIFEAEKNLGSAVRREAEKAEAFRNALLNKQVKKQQAISRELERIKRQEAKRILQEQQDSIKKQQKSVQELTVTWKSFFRLFVSQLAQRAFSSVVNGLQEAVQGAVDLTKEIGAVQTIDRIGLSTNEWAAGLERLSNAYGLDVVQQANAAYFALSNQVVDASQAFEFLDEANKLALAGVTDQTTAVNLLSSVINSYGASVTSAGEISGQLFTALELGRFRFEQIGNVIGRVTVPASQLGVRFEEVLGLLAIISRQGLNVSESLTQIRNIFNKLTKPTSDYSKLLAEQGFQSSQAAIKSEGLLGVLELIVEKTQNAPEQLAKIVNSIRGFAGIQTATKNLSTLEDVIRQISESSDVISEKVDIQIQTQGRQFEILTTNLKNFLINGIGTPALQAINRFARTFGGERGLINLLKAASVAVTTLTVATVGITGPIGIAAAAIAALGSAILLTTGRVSDQEKAIEKYAENVRSAAKRDIDAFNEKLEESLKTLDALESTLQKNVSGVNRLANAILKNSIKSWQELDAEADAAATTLKDKFADAVQTVNNEISNLTSFIDALDNQDKGFGDFVTKLLNADEIKDKGKNFQDALAEALTDIEQAKTNLSKVTDQATLDSSIKILKDGLTQVSKIQSDARKEQAKREDERKKAIEKANEDIEKSEKRIADIRSKLVNLNIKRIGASAKEQRDINISQREAIIDIREEEKKQLAIRKELNQTLASNRDIDIQTVNLKELALQSEKELSAVIAKRQAEAKKELELKRQELVIRERIKREVDQLVQAQGRIDIADVQAAKTPAELDSILNEFNRLTNEITKREGLLSLNRADLLAQATTVAPQGDIANQQRSILQDIISQRKAQLEFNNQIEAGTFELQKLNTEIKNNRERFQKGRGAAAQIDNDLNALINTFEDFATGVLSASLRASGGRGATREFARQIVSGANFDAVLPDATALPKTTFAQLENLSVALFNLQQRFKTGVLDDVTVRNASAAISGVVAAVKTLDSSEINADRVAALERLASVLTSGDAISQQDVEKLEASIEASKQQAVALTTLLNQETSIQANLSEQFKNNVKDTAGFLKEMNQLILNLRAVLPQSNEPSRKAMGGRAGSDMVNALLQPGEFVVNRQQASKFTSQLLSINNSAATRFNNGGSVNVGDVNVTMESSGNTQVDALALGKAIRREVTRGTLKWPSR